MFREFNYLLACNYREAKRFVRYRVEDAELKFEQGKITKAEKTQKIRTARKLLRDTFPDIEHTVPPEKK